MSAVRLLLAGDTALGGDLRDRPAAQLAAGLAPLRDRFADADLRFLSFDCAVGRQGTPPRPEEYIVDCEPATLAVLGEWAVDVVSLANNHATDRGAAALIDGIDRLRSAGPAPVGAGADLEAATAPVMVTRGGLRVGFLAFADEHPWVGALAATATAAGVAPLRPALIEAAVRRLRPLVDVVVVSLHWGKEYLPLPPPASVTLGRRLVDAGVDVVVGHHPHVAQPVEAYGSGVICYSLGNFLFPDDAAQGLAFRGAGRESLLVEVELRHREARLVGLTPVVGDADGSVAPVAAARAAAIRAELQRGAELLGRERHQTEWQRAVRRHELARLRRVLREEVLDAGWRNGTARLLRLGRKNLRSVGRSVGEILSLGRRR